MKYKDIDDVLHKYFVRMSNLDEDFHETVLVLLYRVYSPEF